MGVNKSKAEESAEEVNRQFQLNLERKTVFIGYSDLVHTFKMVLCDKLIEEYRNQNLSLIPWTSEDIFQKRIVVYVIYRKISLEKRNRVDAM